MGNLGCFFYGRFLCPAQAAEVIDGNRHVAPQAAQAGFGDGDPLRLVQKDVHTVFGQQALGIGQELQALIRQLGGEADRGGSVAGALHRGWVSVRGTLGGYSDLAMLDECERGEDAAVASYRKALRTTLPVTVRSVVERQAQGAQRNHDEVKAMRDALRVNQR